MKNKSFANDLYSLSKNINKIASVIKDVEVIATGDPKKIANHYKRKAINKTLYTVNKEINKKVKQVI